MDYKDFFKCKYPIVAAPMNQVSDLKLAIACYNAGIFPSLSLYNQVINGKVDLEILIRIIRDFQNSTGSSGLLLSLAIEDFFKPSVQELILNNKVSHLEIIGDYDIVSSSKWSEFSILMKMFKNNDTTIILKALDSNNVDDSVGGVMLKGAQGAGRGLENLDIDFELIKIKEKHPMVPVVLAGGIGKPYEVKKYINLGCIAVAIGTLLAASEESCVSKETKERMIQSSYDDIIRIKGARQNALIFGKVEDDDYNNTRSLIKGIQSPTEGHILAGKSINSVTKILPVKDIIENLTKGLLF
jgi:hypothetical protein